VDRAKQTDDSGKENKWTQSIADGSKTFIEKMKEASGFRAKGRRIISFRTVKRQLNSLTHNQQLPIERATPMG